MMRSLLSLLFLGCLCAQAQSAKDLRQANVQSCTVTKIYPTATGKENRLERKEIYDEQGKLKELIRYNSSGDIEKNTLFYFSEKGDWKAEVKLKAGKGLRTDSLVEKKLKILAVSVFPPFFIPLPPIDISSPSDCPLPIIPITYNFVS